MNCMFVHLAQIFMITCVYKYTAQAKDFLTEVPNDRLILIARFMASLFMHIYLEVEERQGMYMMKYAVNHHDNFHNPYVAFLFGFISLTLGYFIEVCVIIILTGK